MSAEYSREIVDLIGQVRSGKVAIWIGSGFSFYAGLPNSKEMAKAIVDSAKNLYSQDEAAGPLDEVADIFLNKKTKNELVDVIRPLMLREPRSLQYHNLLTEIPQFKTLITTNYDKLIEKSYGNSLQVVVGDSFYPRCLDYNKPILYKLHGDIEDPNSITISRSDYTGFFAEGDLGSLLWNKIRTIIAEKTLLFIGYSLRDENVKVLLQQLSRYIKQGDMYLVAPNFSNADKERLYKNQVTYIDMTGETIIDILCQHVRKGILKDTLAGKINLEESAKLLKDKGIEAAYTVNSEGRLSFGGINLLKPFTLILEGSGPNQLRRLISGQSFEPVTIGRTDVKRLNLEAQNEVFELPIESSITIRPSPAEKFKADLHTGGTVIQNVSGKIFSSSDKKELVFECANSSTKIVFQFLSGGNAKLRIENPIVEDVLIGLNIYTALSNWLNGEKIVVRKERGGSLSLPSPVINAKSSPDQSIGSLLELYLRLNEIENYYDTKLSIPSSISDEDLRELDKVLSYVRGKKKRIEEPVRLEFDSESVDRAQLTDIEKRDGFVLRVEGSKDDLITLWESQFKIGKYLIESDDAYIDGICDKGDVTTIIIRSQSGVYYYRKTL